MCASPKLYPAAFFFFFFLVFVFFGLHVAVPVPNLMSPLLLAVSSMVLSEAILPAKTRKQPCITLRNAARPGVCMPLTGLGVVGYGCAPGDRSECWHYGTKANPGTCCTHTHCPVVNATREWLQMGGGRIDTGYGYGDDVDNWPPKKKKHDTEYNGEARRRLGTKPFHDLVGVGIAIAQSRVPRESIFVTAKAGMAGPMGPYEAKQVVAVVVLIAVRVVVVVVVAMLLSHGYRGAGVDGDIHTHIAHTYAYTTYAQDLQILRELGLDYIDLLLMHGADTGTPTHPPAHECSRAHYDARQCRLVTYKTLVDHYQSGLAKAIGVANWDADNLQELKDEMANNDWIIMPAVAQYRFHPHKSTANPKVKKLIDFCKDNNITFNGYSPLGSPDFTTFAPSVGTPSLLAEPQIRSIAARVNKTAAQVILRWHAQQNIVTNPRTMNTTHMRENLDSASGSWSLSDADMTVLSTMPQCAAERGNRYDENCIRVFDGIARYGNETGPTRTC